MVFVLNPHTDRLALSCIMEIDHRQVIDHKVVNSVIHSDYRMTYTAVREILEDGTPALLTEYQEIVPMLQDMNKLRIVLAEKRKKRGSVNFDLPESKIILDENGKPIDIRPYERSIATNLIEEFMLVCNKRLQKISFGKKCLLCSVLTKSPMKKKRKNGTVFVWVWLSCEEKDGELHPREIQKVLSEIEGKTEERVITRVVLRSMMQARYTADNQGHFGLAAKYYCHFILQYVGTLICKFIV